MNPKETAKSYDELASHWNGADFNRKNGIEQHHRALRFTKNRFRVIDIGGGSSGRIIELLIEEGFEVEGLDISPKMIEFAKARHPKQKLHLADFCDWDFPKKYDFISAWDSACYAPLDRQESLLANLCNGLNAEGVLIITRGGLDQPDERSNPCLVQPLHHATLGIPKLLQVIDRSGCICRHLEYDQYPELHIYLIIQKTEGTGVGA